MKLYRMIEIYLKYDKMHTFGIINTFICINNHVNSCINSMLSHISVETLRIDSGRSLAKETTELIRMNP